MMTEQDWELRMQSLEQFVEREHHARVPSSHQEVVGRERVPLGRWVAYIRARYRDGRLRPERAKRLEAIRGWEWGPLRPGPNVPAGRDDEIIKLYRQGWSQARIGLRFNLSRQRVKQIIDARHS